VEDDILIAMELEDVLRQQGFEVMGPVPSVEAALRSVQEGRPDAAVLDVSLRGKRVTPVAEVLLAMKVPFVLTSAYGVDDLAGEPSLSQAVNLGKPTPHGELIAVMRSFAASAGT
jgi:DNA-binding response OmpR family regulator